MMLSDYKQPIVWIAGGLAVLLVLGTLAYSVFFRTPSGTSQPNGQLPAGEGRTIGSTGGETPAGEGEPSTGSPSEPVLSQLHDKPVVSSVVFSRASRLYARFMEEGTGHVYEYDIAEKKPYRISNTSVPKIQEAFWSTDGSVVAFRYEDGGVLKAAVAELATTTTEGAFKKVNFLPLGIKSLALSPDGSQVFYIIAGSSAGTAQGVVAKSDGSSPRVVFTSRLPRWFASWPAQTSILVSSPWADDGGLVYRIQPQTGAQSIMFSTQSAFMGASGGPKGEVLINDPATALLSSLLAPEGALTPHGIPAWPSLCAFASSSTSTAACARVPRDGLRLFSEWQRGERDFASSLVLIDFSGGLPILAIPEEELGDRVFDIVSPALAPDASYATFKNRVDGMLWGVRIN